MAVSQSVFTDHPVLRCQNITHDKTYLDIPITELWPHSQGHNKRLKFDFSKIEEWHILTSVVGSNNFNKTNNCLPKVYHIFHR